MKAESTWRTATRVKRGWGAIHFAGDNIEELEHSLRIRVGGLPGSIFDLRNN